MPRKPRIEFAGAIYHIMSRGNRGEPIFRDDADRETFLGTLDEACSRTGWMVHAFVLMGNHYHVLLETPEGNLVAGMKWLQGTYTQRFNSRHKLWGHLLQGRYKSLLVDGASGDYFSTVASYVHLNPARAGLFDLRNEPLQMYRWSSFPLYFDPSKRPDWLCVNRTLGALGLEDDGVGLERYAQYMDKRVLAIAESAEPRETDAAWAGIRRGWCLGSDNFRMELLERIDSLPGKRVSFSGTPIRLHDEQSAEQLLVKGLEALGLDERAVVSLRKGADEKALLAWLLHRYSVVSNAWIADRLAMGRADCLSRYPRRIEETTDEELAGKRELLRTIITSLRD